MYKRKINVELQNINLIDAGMSVYARAMLSRLVNYEDLELMGTVFRVGLFHPGYNLEEYEYFGFPVKFTRLPEWVVGGRPVGFEYRIAQKILKCFVPNYNSWVGDNKSDVFLFFMNYAPALPIKGKVITCVHDIIPLRVHTSDFEPEFVDFYRKAFKNVIEKSTKIITDSKFSKQDIVDYAHINESQIDVIYCGVNTEEFQRPFDREFIRAKYNLPEKYILYFGTSVPRKNVESVIKAYARLSEATRQEYALVITNPKEAIKACAVENNVTPHFIENVSKEDKAAVYQMASVLVWLSIYEGFGLPIIEAQAAGTPVVCSNVTSLPEVAGDATVLVDPMDTETTTAAIERCLYDAPFRQDLIAKGHENIKRFSWDDAAKRLHDIILNL